MSRAIVLLSGGMDSLVTAAIAIRDNDTVCFLHVNYGQRTESKELECFQNLCNFYKPEKSLVIKMDWLGQIGGSALTDTKIEIKDHPNGNVPYSSEWKDNFSAESTFCSTQQEIPQTYVPFRNANLISAAVAWAEVVQADSIYIGAVEEDSSGYPDCRNVFFQSMQKTIETGTLNTKSLNIITPVIDLKKHQIVRLGKELNVPFEYSWSCYKNNLIACGVCDSCYLRLRAFDQAGVCDPIPYERKLS